MSRYHSLMKICALGTMALFASFGAYASDNSVTQLPAEGNVQCNDYAANKVVLSMDTNSPLASGNVTGPENPNDADTTGESASYSVINGTSLSFVSTTPVDYVVLKSSREVQVYMYASGGTTDDANITIPRTGGDLPITAFSLCYALGNTAPPPPPPSVTPSCNLQGILDATGITCPSDGSRTLVCNIELDKAQYGLADGSDGCCICNASALTECNPDLPSDEPGACPEGGNKTGLEVTTHFEFNNDPYYCYTSGGRRICYPY